MLLAQTCAACTIARHQKPQNPGTIPVPRVVGATGHEPVCPCETSDFKSNAYTNSATRFKSVASTSFAAGAEILSLLRLPFRHTPNYFKAQRSWRTGVPATARKSLTWARWLVKIHLSQAYLPHRLPFQLKRLLEPPDLLFDVRQRLVTLAITQLILIEIRSLVTEMHNLLTDLSLESGRNEISLNPIIFRCERSRVYAQ